MQTSIVRFVGGPWHNRHVRVRLLPRISVGIITDQGLLVDLPHLGLIRLTVDYQLVYGVTNWGCIFCEYHVPGLTDQQLKTPDDCFVNCGYDVGDCSEIIAAWLSTKPQVERIKQFVKGSIQQDDACFEDL